MHAWAALKPADIVQAVRALRDMVKGRASNEEAEAVAAADVSPEESALTRDSAAAE